MASKWLLLSLLFLALTGCQALDRFFVASTPTTAPTQAPTFPAVVLPSATLPPAPTAAPLPSSTAQPPTPKPTDLPALVLSSKTITETSAKPAYTLKLNYPVIAGLIDARFTAFNQEAEKLAHDTAASFRKDFSGIPADPNFGPSFAEMTYTVTNGTHGLLSILFTVSFYASGAAHPNMYYQSLTYDLIHSKKLALGDLFKVNTPYLQTIADYCAADLKTRGRLESPEGAKATPENYQSWNVTPQGLVISFDPYQVGPYAMGPSTVAVPFSALKSLVNPAGPLAPLLP